MRHVRGVLFLDYVRMLRAQRQKDWSEHLPPEDVAYLGVRIDPEAWYPMATFERMGNEILRSTAQGKLEVVRLWGRFSAGQLRAVHPTLLAPQDPVDTLTRFRVLRETFFDFAALDVPMLHDSEATIAMRYHMGMPAEEAACYQTLGFFEGLLELAGARQVTGTFRQRSWSGDADTVADLSWNLPSQLS